jgi:hypothetical protein
MNPDFAVLVQTRTWVTTVLARRSEVLLAEFEGGLARS